MKPDLVHPAILELAGLSGQWRWLEPGEAVMAGDHTDFDVGAGKLRPALQEEIGYVVPGDEQYDWLRRYSSEEERS